RLVRPAIGERSYRKENKRFRDAARPLTQVRDAKILIETLDDLTEHFQEHIAGRSFGKVRKALQNHLRSVRRRVLDEQQAFNTVAAGVSEGGKRTRRWSSVPNKWPALGDGLKMVFRRAADAFAEAQRDPTVENLHEWRKQAKYLRYQ